jgi:hypothetical protein
MVTKILKLTDGDLIICDVDEDQDKCGELSVMRPMRLIIIPDKGIALGMWMPQELDQPAKIAHSHIGVSAIAAEGLATEYRSKFSNIIQPTASKLVI